jgi:hypothetical protein
MIFLNARNREVAFKLPLCLRALIAVDAVSAADVRACDACFYEPRELDERLLMPEIYCCLKQYAFLDGK